MATNGILDKIKTFEPIVSVGQETFEEYLMLDNLFSFNYSPRISMVDMSDLYDGLDEEETI